MLIYHTSPIILSIVSLLTIMLVFTRRTTTQTPVKMEPERPDPQHEPAITSTDIREQTNTNTDRMLFYEGTIDRINEQITQCIAKAKQDPKTKEKQRTRALALLRQRQRIQRHLDVMTQQTTLLTMLSGQMEEVESNALETIEKYRLGVSGMQSVETAVNPAVVSRLSAQLHWNPGEVEELLGESYLCALQTEELDSEIEKLDIQYLEDLQTPQSSPTL